MRDNRDIYKKIAYFYKLCGIGTYNLVPFMRGCLKNLEITNLGRLLISLFCVVCFIVHYPKWSVAIIS